MQKVIPKREMIGKASYVEITPNAYRTMSALREMGYKSTDALLDIVDNSLDAGASRIDLTIKDVSGGKGTDFVIDIQDNGSGMDEEKLKEALRLGSQREYNPEDLGRFGVGLVTAGLSIGRSIRVLTRKEGRPAYDALMDLDTIAKHNQFLIELRPAMAKDAMQRLPDQGTIVSLSKVDRINDRNLSRFQERLREAVGRVYRNYIARAENPVKFYVGNRLVKAVDPLLLDHELTQVKLDTDINFAPGKTAHLKVVELPDLGLLDAEVGITARNSGFYLVRNGREIAAAETFGFAGLESRHHSYSHFRAELSFTRELDEFFHVNVKKNFIQLDDRMISKLETHTEHLIRDSGRQSRDRALAAPPPLPKQSHERAQQLLNEHAIQFIEEDLGEDQPMFEKRKNQIVFNRQHPVLTFVAGEARQRPALVLDVLTAAMAAVAERVPQGKKFMEALEVQLRETLKKK